MRSWLLGLLLFPLTLLPLVGADLGKFLEQDALWEMSSGELQKRYPDLFGWSDASQTELSAIGKNAEAFQYHDLTLREVRLGFREGKLVQIKLLLYSRGDSGAWKQGDFKAALEKLSGELRLEQGTVPDRRLFVLGGSVKVTEQCWRGPKGVWSLCSGVDRKGAPEFISLAVMPPGGERLSVRRNARAKSSRASLPERIQTDASGTKYLNVPMVNQGKKPYCVPAVVERILLYYGSELDQNAIARLLDTDAQKGTHLEKAIERLRRVAGRLGLHFRDEYRFREFDPRRVGFFFKRYNREAKKRKKDTLELKKANLDAPPNFDPDVLAAVRNRETADKTKCWKSIQRWLAQGIPVCWSVFLFPDKTRPGRVSAHFRIINGINERTGEIVFTDSWGPGHEKKTMPWDQAWPITMRLLVLSPADSGAKK